LKDSQWLSTTIPRMLTPRFLPLSTNGRKHGARSGASTTNIQAFDAAAQKAIRLERKIARMPAMTAEGYHAKIEVIRKAELEDEVLLTIMFLLGRDVERLGIADAPPDLRADW